MPKTFNLNDLNLPYGTHKIKIRAKAAGYADSDFSNEIEFAVQPKLGMTDSALRVSVLRDNVTSIEVHKNDEANTLVTTVPYEAASGDPFDIPLEDVQTEEGDLLYIVCKGDGVNDNKSNLVDPNAVGKDFATDSDEVVEAENLRIADYFEKYGELPFSNYKIGDRRSVQLTSGEDGEFVIIGMCHDTLVKAYDNGATKAGLTLQFYDCLKTTKRWHSTTSGTANSYINSEMKKTTLPTILSQLPSKWRTMARAVRKKVAKNGNTTDLDEITDVMWLPSHVEVFGTTKYSISSNYSKEGEGEQYAYFKNAPVPDHFEAMEGVKGTFVGSNNGKYKTRFGVNRSTSTNVYYNYNLDKGLGTEATSATSWWLRSPNSGYSSSACCVSSTGNVSSYSVTSSRGVAPCFCI